MSEAFPCSIPAGFSLDYQTMRFLADAMPQPVWFAGTHGHPIYANKQWYDYTGLTTDILEAHPWQAGFHPDDRSELRRAWHMALTTGINLLCEARIKRWDDVYRWHCIQAAAQRDAAGKIWLWVATATDIDEQKRTEEALRESEVRFRRLVDANIVGVTIADRMGAIHEANDAFLALTGYTQEELDAGQIKWTKMTPPEYWEKDGKALKSLLKTGTFSPYEKEYIRKDGQRIPVLVGGAIFRWEGAIPWWVALTLDLTAHKEVERQKDFLLAMTGHELKTPLAALKGTFQLIQRRMRQITTLPEAVPSEVSTFMADLTRRLANATRQVDAQEHLINDLLDVSRIAANTLKLDLELCDLIALVRESVDDLRAIAPNRAFLTHLPEQHRSLTVFIDRERICQVIKNYGSNALRYSPPEQPIHLGLDIQEKFARVWVRDHGPGLTEEAQQEVWQRFHQIKGVTAQTGSGKGLGLGLYLCHMLIIQHQGQVGVESTPGSGSTFWFTLPLA